MAHLVVDISAHGFGHLAQVAAVMGALRPLAPDLELTVRSAHQPEVLSRFLPSLTRHLPPPPDPVMAMTGPSSVDLEATLATYKELHRDFAGAVERERTILRDLAPDLLLSNIPYTSLHAAKEEGLPAIALCSLNWHDILEGYAHDEDAAAILSEMKTAYLGAELFLQPTPSMPMAWHPGRRPIGPIARKAPALIRPRNLPKPRDQGGPSLVLLGLGGIKSDFDPGVLPAVPDILWVAPSVPAGLKRSDLMSVDETGTDFLGVLSLADTVVTKSGYGTFAEAACHGTRVLFAERPDWPEAPHIESWLLDHGTAAAITQEALYQGAFLDDLRALLNRPASAPVAPTGAGDAAAILMAHLA